MCAVVRKHNPFDWVHSEFGYVVSIVLFFGAFVFTAFKPGAPLATFLEGLLGLNALFFLKQYGKNQQEVQKIKIESDANPAQRGDPLS